MCVQFAVVKSTITETTFRFVEPVIVTVLLGFRLLRQHGVHSF